MADDWALARAMYNSGEAYVKGKYVKAAYHGARAAHKVYKRVYPKRKAQTVFAKTYRRKGGVGVKRKFALKNQSRYNGVVRATVRQGKYTGKLAAYHKTLRSVMCRPETLIVKFEGSLNNMADNNQGKCQWHSFENVSPGVYDQVLASAFGNTIANVPPTQETLLSKCETNVQLKNNSVHSATLTVYRCCPRYDINTFLLYGNNPSLLVEGFTNQSLTSQASASMTYDTAGATPFMSTDWVAAVKTKQCLRKTLLPGESINLSMKLKRNSGFQSVREE